MSAKHTPGPWHIGGISNPNTDPRYSIWGPTPEGAQSGEWIAKDVTPANAHPIAAAPELLEGVEKDVARFGRIRDILAETMVPDGNAKAELMDYVLRCQIESRALIARAEGAQS